jgi:hypothetical protein
MGEQNSFNQQNQWKDFDPSTTNGPPEGERGLGATVVGGAGVSTIISGIDLADTQLIILS